MDFNTLGDISNEVGLAIADVCRSRVLSSCQYHFLDRESMKDLLGEGDFSAAIECDHSKRLVKYGKIGPLVISRTLQPGEYVFKVEVLDELSGEVAENETRFSMIP